LIFSPAVGSGVGSHLLGTTENSPALLETQENKTYNLPTVDRSISTTVIDNNMTTVDTLSTKRTKPMRSAASILQHLPLVTQFSADAKRDMSTVVTCNTPTVDMSATVAAAQATEAMTYKTTVDENILSTVVELDMPTVVTCEENGGSVTSRGQAPNELALREGLSELAQGGEELPTERPAPEVSADSETETESNLSTVDSAIQINRQPKEVVLWISEQGDLVTQGRVKRIRLAQDVINSAEESVYDTLWTKSQNDEREAFRVVQAGYDYLVKRTRLSKKTIQRIVAKLIDKDFLAVERPADIYQRTSTVYRVFSYKAVLDRHLKRGRFHVAKIGPGFSYVRPMEDPRLSTLQSAQLGITNSTGPSDLSTVVNTLTSTAANRTTVTVDESDVSTVVRATTSYIGKDVLGNTSSSSSIYQMLSKYGAVDDDIIDRLIRNCRQQAPDCTEEEIIHFIEEKGSLVQVRDSRIYSPIGFLLTAVPKCLSGEAFRYYRAEEITRRQAEAANEGRRQAELDEWRREQEERLADPSVSDQDKQFIRECLGIR
jgi:predicted transcriptional regulator